MTEYCCKEFGKAIKDRIIFYNEIYTIEHTDTWDNYWTMEIKYCPFCGKRIGDK